ncbi:hypothetical protein ACQ4M3_19290 [Leptolyngbya sp. AN03gr2]|uniref:hypothetical protein n=1 Tax=Leptolyngbya sp. AN03gr2 TaxID=3423364 RepID=UPI003D3129C8
MSIEQFTEEEYQVYRELRYCEFLSGLEIGSPVYIQTRRADHWFYCPGVVVGVLQMPTERLIQVQIGADYICTFNSRSGKSSFSGFYLVPNQEILWGKSMELEQSIHPTGETDAN